MPDVLTGISAQTTSAALTDITDPALTHFGSFLNQTNSGDFSEMSSDAATSYGQFGWHMSPSSGFPLYAGILFGTTKHTVTGLNFQIHVNPIQHFVLQGCNNTTTGLDGDWSNVFSSTVIHPGSQNGELSWQSWTFSNTIAYSAYRVKIEDDYAKGFAMYRWEMLEDSTSPVPIPAAAWLLGSGVIGLIGLGRKRIFGKS
jgi:hypothetical protein